LAEYAAQIADLGADRVRMVATSATRDASNAEDFRAMVVSTLGVEPEVITGDEEARLSFTGALRGLPPDAQPPYLVVDIGGGSTEFVLGKAADGALASRDSNVDTTVVTHAVSVDIGCVRMTERHFGDRAGQGVPSDPPSAQQVAAAEADITAGIERALAVVPGRGARTLVGLAGSVTTVAALALGLDRYDPALIHGARIPYPQVAAVSRLLLALTHEQRLALAPMHPGRADVIGAGALVLRIAMERVGVESVVVSEQDILDGIADSLRGPGRDGD
jgi:exopolyphosphatase/guanosine-5'-triphosphate,3'-diphosphate pyrophosphatase